jgi:hypothetical protein
MKRACHPSDRLQFAEVSVTRFIDDDMMATRTIFDVGIWVKEHIPVVQLKFRANGGVG